MKEKEKKEDKAREIRNVRIKAGRFSVKCRQSRTGWCGVTCSEKLWGAKIGEKTRMC